MADLSGFARFAAKVGRSRKFVAPVAPAKFDGCHSPQSYKITQYQRDNHFVAPVAPVAPDKIDSVQKTDLHDRFEERAAIMEYDGCMTREQAEPAAWLDVYGVAKPTIN